MLPHPIPSYKAHLHKIECLILKTASPLSSKNSNGMHSFYRMSEGLFILGRIGLLFTVCADLHYRCFPIQKETFILYLF